MRHFQNFDKIDSFLKPALNIFIVRNLILGLWERVNKEGAGILHGSYRFRGLVFCMKAIVGRSRVNESKNWYYLGPFEPSKIGLLEIFFRL